MENKKNNYIVHPRTEGVKPNALRKQDKVPGVIYGGMLESALPVEIERSVLTTLLKNNTKSSVIEVEYKGRIGSVIVREVQRDGATGAILHVDLQAIRKDDVLTLEVPITYTGEEEVSSRRLIVNMNLTHLQIKGPADKIPEHITVDLTGKTPEDKIEVSSIELPDGVELVTDHDELLATIAESKVAQEVEAEIAAETEAAETAADEVPVVDDTKTTENE